MARVRPFRGLRPTPEQAEKVAAPPYDVMSTPEAREMAAGNPVSFLRVTRAEIEFGDEQSPYADEVYQRGGDNLQKLQADGVMVQDQASCFYLYRQKMGTHEQTGIVATTSCQEYDTNEIRKHEHTRPGKEKDRTRHITALGAQTGPVWLAYRTVAAIDEVIATLTAAAPTRSFTAPDGIVHTYWVIDDPETVAQLRTLFAEQVPRLYIADGHHRSAAASHVARAGRERGDGPDAPSQFFLSVIYPHSQLKILPYNRYVSDLNGHDTAAFQAAIAAHFDVSPLLEAPGPGSPPERHQFDMYLAGQWFRLKAKAGTFDANDPIDSLDVQILQKQILSPLLGIDDPRTNERIDFIGGIRGHRELVKRVEQGGGVAFACFATSMEQLFDVADAKEVMPPKSTWFEPKLRSGLFVHLLP